MSFVKLSKPLFPSPGSVKGLRFKVSPNGRYLMTTEGRPFYYLADTAWTLFKRLNHSAVPLAEQCCGEAGRRAAFSTHSHCVFQKGGVSALDFSDFFDQDGELVE